MTLEEAKKLKPGDRVLVEMTVSVASDARTIERDRYVWLTTQTVNLGYIREKIAPPRRKFKKGDIVKVKSGHFLVVDQNEDSEAPLVTVKNKEEDFEFFPFSDLTLICAVEDRADNARKPITVEPCSVSRRRGNLAASEEGGEV